jgi:uncharacterized repeat protein (TIGR01451 family)
MVRAVRAASVLAAAGSVAAMLAVGTSADISNVGSGTIGPPPASTSMSWSGSAIAANTTGPSDPECNANGAHCDDYALTVATGGIRRGSFAVDVSWLSPEDYDLYIYDKNGDQIGSSGNPNAVPEAATVDCPSSDLSPYRIRIVYFTTLSNGHSNYSATAAYSDKTCPVAPPDRIATHHENALSFAPSTLVSSHFLGVEPQTTMERIAPWTPKNNRGGIDNNRIFVDWPLSSRSNIGQLSRSLDGGESFRLLVDQTCAARNRPNCATGGGGDTDSDVNLTNGNVFFADQEVLANEASATSLDHGDSWLLQTPISSQATATDREWLAATDDSQTVGGVGPKIEAFFSYHVPPSAFIHAIPDTTHLPLPQATPQLTNTGQTGQPKVDNNPASPGHGWIYYPFRPFQGGGTSVATAPSSGYQLATNWHVSDVTENAAASFPWIAIDSAGNAYLTWDSSGIVYYAYSPIADARNNPALGGTPGTYWSPRARVTPPGVTSAVFPEAISGGDVGRLGVTYMGTTEYAGDPNGAGTEVHWNVYAAVVTAANSDTPVVDTGIVQHRPYVHRGNICSHGTSCGLPVVGDPTKDDRSLADMIDVGFDSSGRLGVVYQDNNTASFQDQTVQDFSPFVYFAKQVTGQTLFAATSPVNITVSRDARDDPSADATFPNTAAGTNIPALDILRTSVSLEGSNIVAHVKLANASLSAMTNAITAYNAGAVTQPAQRLQYVVRFNSGNEAYHLSLEVLPNGTLRSFGGKLDANDGIANPGNPTSDIAAGYHTDAGFQVSNTITPGANGEIVLAAPASQFGLASGNDLYSVIAFGTAGPLEQTEQTQTGIPQNALYVMRTVDASPPFDTTLLAGADLNLAKTDSPDPAHVGQLLTYTLTVTNNGPQNATGVVVTDSLPKSTGFGSASAPCVRNGKTNVTCNFGTLASGSSASATINVKPTSKGTITNTATVSSTSRDPNSGNNTATAQTTVQP